MHIITVFASYLSINDWLMYLGPKVEHYANEIANHAIGEGFFNSVFDTGSGFPDVSVLWDGASPWSGNVARWDFFEYGFAARCRGSSGYVCGARVCEVYARISRSAVFFWWRVL